MGKRQHQSDKMYLTSKEWSAFYGGKKTDSQKSEFRRLPFDHCSLSLQPFEHPYCTPDGIIFDLMSIVPFIKKYKANPITGEPLDAKSLIKLNFHKNNDGKYHCPVTFKVFNENTHIVAVRPTGNVYCHEAIEQLNIKAKNWKDLLTDEAFKRSDIITVQDPSQLDKFNISTFHHIKNNLKVEDEAEMKARKDPKYTLNKTNVETEDILGTLYKEYQPTEEKEETKKKADKLNAAHYSTGMVAAGFTSTVMAPQTVHEAESMATNEEINPNDHGLSAVILEIIKEFPELLGRSQMPEAKEKKHQALQVAKRRIQKDLGKKLESKQIMKKIANMKTHVKKKNDACQRRSRRTAMCAWEMELYGILHGDENTKETKMEHSTSDEIPAEATNGSLHVPSDPSTSTHRHEESSDASTHDVNATAKRKLLPGETEETADLSTLELQRLVLLEQLRYTRMKIRRLEQSDWVEDMQY